ncbi:pollen-specific leucine-rich repeat extensin-like protein 2 [Clupea harengus]|uniref:Pollen-specific leucine-rich repeat extensin-like protein 2 n=1 Tax=Clupea harengus TaxID=7950 RepID=A0A6P8GT11_CLUHA|nr:pollen-specific leucine-rich repeat extensin-like protein 2 [Clupea harengus]
MGRHIGVQVMGTDFLAEIRAKKERMAAATMKVSEPSSPEKTEPTAVQGSSEEDQRSPERKALAETRPEPAPRTFPPPVSTKPTTGIPKPPVPSAKPALSPRNSGPLKTRTSSSRSIDESPDSASGGSSPKVPGPTQVPVPAQGHKRAPSDAECESVMSPSPEDPERRECPSEVAGDSSVFDLDQDSATVKHSSSLRCLTNPVLEADDRQRIKSLPTPVKLFPEDDIVLSPGLPPPPLDLPEPIPEDQPPDADTNA